MTSVNSFYSGSYYSLAKPQTEADTAGNKATSTATLLSALSTKTAATAEAATSTDSAYTLDLSPAAQAYIASLNNGGQAASTTSSSDGIKLNTQQLEQVKAILAKYKDAPQTQETFNKIQDDLKAAGLGAEQLAIKNQMASFNPTTTLIAALDGTAPEVKVQNPADIMAAQKAKADKYMENIQTLWQVMAASATEN